MNKKLVSLVLSSLIVLNNASYIKNIYAYENKGVDKLIENQDTKSKKIVYVEDGEGEAGLGDGSENHPYQNIRTALANIEDGETLKLVGEVKYTKYKSHSDGSALPLFIDKSITIEGESVNGDCLLVRSPIQLGADVTFKNIRLQLVSETILGRNNRIIGQGNPRAATIFAAGHKLTLDNVNTRVGASQNQYNARPYISGGSFKNQGKLGEKAIINIKNPNAETLISRIYAGDYWNERSFDVDINLDGRLVENTIYTGVAEASFNGNVVVNLGDKSNVTKIDKTNHKGKMDVKLEKGVFYYGLDLNGINDLTLEEGSRVTLANDSSFDVHNVILRDNAVIDFRHINGSPIVRGNFEGEENVNNDQKGGAILLNNDQTLDITGKLTGKTRLNNNNQEYVEVFKENHKYVKANLNSTGELSIEDSIYKDFVLKKTTDNNITTWTTVRLKQAFKDFKWVGGDDNIINPTFGDEYRFPIEFIDDQNKSYKPHVTDLNDDFTFTLQRPNGTMVEEDDEDIEFYLNAEKIYDPSEMNEILLYIDNAENLEGEMILKATYNKTGKYILKTINIIKDHVQLTGTVNIINKAVAGRKISAETSDLPSDANDLTYKWYVNGEEVIGQTGKDFVLTEAHVGKKVKVLVGAKGYLRTISSQELIVKPSNIAPVIKGAVDTEIKVSEVDKFNNLAGVTVTDDIDENLKVKVTGKVEKPLAGTNKIYELTYEVVDKDGNKTRVVRKVKVTNQVPVISGLSDITITKGKSADIKKGIKANDKEDGDITKKIVYPKTNLSTLKPGTHKIEYTVKDSDGNTTKATRTVKVLNTFSTFTVNSIKKSDTYISGKGLKNATVKAYVSGKEVGSIKVASNGTYKIKLKSKIANGKEVTLKISYSGYTTKEISTKVLNEFSIFAVNNIKKSDTYISGKGLKNAAVKAYVSGKEVGSTKVASNGTYKIKLKSKIANGKEVTLKISYSGYATKEISTKVLNVFSTFTINKVSYKDSYVTGKGLKGSQIKVYNGKTLVGKGTVSSKGSIKVKLTKKQKKNTKLTIKMIKSGYATVEKSVTVK